MLCERRASLNSGRFQRADAHPPTCRPIISIAPTKVTPSHRQLEGMLRCKDGAQLGSGLGQTQPPRLDLKDLLARQMTPHIPDSAVAAAPIVAVCHRTKALRASLLQAGNVGWNITEE